MNEQEFNSLPIAQRKAAQQRLIDAGLYSGSPDGRWGAGTATAFKNEAQRRVETEERDRKAKSEQDEKSRRLKIDETAAEAAAEEKKAAAQKTRQATKDAEAKSARKTKYDEDAASGLGMAAKFGANIASPAVTGIGGFKAGQATNAVLNSAQEYMNKKLERAAADRVAGLTTRDAARDAVTRSGAMPIGNRALRVGARMVPHIGLGGLGIGKGAQILYDTDPDQPYYAYQADRGAGLGYIGAGAGMLKAGMGHAAAPRVTPDSGALSVINSSQLRRSGIGGAPTQENAAALSRGPLNAIDAEFTSEPPVSKKALPAPDGETPPAQSPRSHASRLIAAAKAGEASGIKNKGQAATWLQAPGNLTPENRAAIAKELGVKPGASFEKRILTAVKNMAKKPGASAIAAPLAAASLAFAATPDRAEAADGTTVGGTDEALTNAGVVGAGAYGVDRLIKAIPPAAGRAAGAGLSMLTPMMYADAYDPTQEELNRDRNDFARILPSWARAGGIEDAYQMAQVPERAPVKDDEFATARALQIPEGIPLPQPDGEFDPRQQMVDQAMNIVRRAAGGRVSGGFHYDTGGRTDNIPLDVIPGSYIVPADVVSALGQGNTMAGIKVLDNMFPPQLEIPQKAAAGGRAKEGDGTVPIIVAGGEFKVEPYHVAALGNGDVKQGADALDAWIKDVRQQHIDTLSTLPGPAQ